MMRDLRQLLPWPVVNPKRFNTAGDVGIRRTTLSQLTHQFISRIDRPIRPCISPMDFVGLAIPCALPSPVDLQHWCSAAARDG